MPFSHPCVIPWLCLIFFLHHIPSPCLQRPLKAQLTAEVGAAADEHEASNIRAAFEKREKQLEHEIDHRPLEVHMSLSVAYNFLSK